MEIIGQMGQMKDRIRRDRSEREMEDVRRENLRLKAEARLLQDELEHDRGDVARLLSAIERTTAGKPHRFGRIVALAGAATAAYVMGAKAGRQRYEDIRAAVSSAMRKGSSMVQGIRNRADQAVDEAQTVAGRISDAGQVVGDTVRAVAEGPIAADAGMAGSGSSRPS
jgi:methyl-accepting chemotaxis protein